MVEVRAAEELVAADRYLEVFGEHGRGDHVPEALFARGEALRGMERMEEAEGAFGDVANDWPEHGLAARAMLSMLAGPVRQAAPQALVVLVVVVPAAQGAGLTPPGLLGV